VVCTIATHVALLTVVVEQFRLVYETTSNIIAI